METDESFIEKVKNTDLIDENITKKLDYITNRYFESFIDALDFWGQFKLFQNFQDKNAYIDILLKNYSCINSKYEIKKHHDFLKQIYKFHENHDIFYNSYKTDKYYLEFDVKVCIGNDNDAVEIFSQKLANSNFYYNKIRYSEREIWKAFKTMTVDEKTWDFAKVKTYLCCGLEYMYIKPVGFFNNFNDFYDCISMMKDENIIIRENEYNKKKLILHIIEKFMNVFHMQNLNEIKNIYTFSYKNGIHEISQYLLLLLILLLEFNFEKIKISGHFYTQKNLKYVINSNKKVLADRIYSVKGTDNNKKAYYYTLVAKPKSLFDKCLSDSIIHLENHGFVIASGYGLEVPENISEEMKHEFDIA
jgi:hypothetical protein